MNNFRFNLFAVHCLSPAEWVGDGRASFFIHQIKAARQAWTHLRPRHVISLPTSWRVPENARFAQITKCRMVKQGRLDGGFCLHWNSSVAVFRAACHKRPFDHESQNEQLYKGLISRDIKQYGKNITILWLIFSYHSMSKDMKKCARKPLISPLLRSSSLLGRHAEKPGKDISKSKNDWTI